MIKEVRKSILFITTSNLAVNPRLVKELQTCVEIGHKTTVLLFEFSDWSKLLNNELLAELRISSTFIIINDNRKSSGWLLSSIANVLSKILLTFKPNDELLLSISSFKRSVLLIAKLLHHKKSYDWVIAHNPGTFFPSLMFAKKNNIKLGIDLEDFHPGESNHPAERGALERIVRKAVENADVITAASDMILEHSLKLTSNHKATAAVVNNVFPLKRQPAWKRNVDMPLKLIWFSQNVGLDRGIQDVISALNTIHEFKTIFTIIGNCTSKTEKHLSDLLKNGNHQLRFMPPAKEGQLIEECSCHHIGLALETANPPNRDFCLTNKLFIYLLAGNAIVASQTAAQKTFLDNHLSVGRTYPVGDHNQLAAVLASYYKYPHILKEHRTNAYQLAKTKYNWDVESQQWVELYGLN
jgi:glycosyltransferase involved in cell wall biosynthesis